MGQTIAFASFVVAVGLTADIDKGVVDRFRSLPINPAAILVGRSMSSLTHSFIGIIVMSLTGLIVGWRIRGSVLDALAAYGLLLLWGFAMIWVGILVGSAMRSVEAVNGVMFTTMFPLTFLSNAFAPSEKMGTVLRALAEWNPYMAGYAIASHRVAYTLTDAATLGKVDGLKGFKENVIMGNLIPAGTGLPAVRNLKIQFPFGAEVSEEPVQSGEAS
jgi:ABC-type multidrug transport system permease subunit